MDSLSPAERSARMAQVRSKNTGPEMVVRQLVYRLGYRYRLHGPKLPGRPDLVFKSKRRVLFVHGCFWHRHPKPGCPLARLPKSRQDFWIKKLEGNRARDESAVAALEADEWRVLTLWECELKDEAALAQKVLAFLDDN